MSGTLADRFLKTVGKYPDRPGLHPGLHPGKIYTYDELKQAALKKADEIAKNNPGWFVPVIADKSFECYTRILGALIAGKAYLPLNPRFPEERNRFMMEKAATGTPSLEPAYLLFTSGSTGKPKGVAVSHQHVGAYLDFMMKAYDFSPEDRFTQNFDLTFDLSVHDLFLCWSAGACLYVPEDSSSFGMAQYLKKYQPTIWFSVPSVVSLMDRMRLLKPAAFPSIRLSFFCGEALAAGTVAAWKVAAPGSRMVNLYGPTEATIAISRYDIPDDLALMKQRSGIVSIGKIFENNDYWLAGDKQLEAPGHNELCLTGAQVVEGYLDNPEADRQSFFTDKKGTSWYKTGDLVMEDEEGDLFFLGRLDTEVKISGYRVNLREIENVLTGYDKADQVVVIFDRAESGQERLLAFILPKINHEADERELDVHCRNLLPWYMVPVKYIFVSEIPLNPNGKIDRAALMKDYSDVR